ncbi:MAG: glycosyltransferase, partial [Acidobacteriota bacterium]
TRVGGAEEAVVDGRSGILVEPGDVEGMARRVIHVLRDQDLRRRMAERAKEGLERFDIRSMVRRQEELYRELLEDRSLKDSPALARAG